MGIDGLVPPLQVGECTENCCYIPPHLKFQCYVYNFTYYLINNFKLYAFYIISIINIRNLGKQVYNLFLKNIVVNYQVGFLNK